MVSRKGFEPLLFWFVAKCVLRYTNRTLGRTTGIEPANKRATISRLTICLHSPYDSEYDRDRTYFSFIVDELFYLINYYIHIINKLIEPFETAQTYLVSVFLRIWGHFYINSSIFSFRTEKKGLSH